MADYSITSSGGFVAGGTSTVVRGVALSGSIPIVASVPSVIVIVKSFIITGSIGGVATIASTFTFSPNFVIVGSIGGEVGLSGSILVSIGETFIIPAIASLESIIEFSKTNAIDAIVVTVENSARTEYSNYALNSMIQFDGKQYGADSTGIYLLEGSDDAGTEIELVFRTPSADSGLSIKKEVEDIFVGCEIAGTMQVRIVTDRDTFSNPQYKDGEAGEIETRRVKIPLNLLSRYWGIELRNVDGSLLNVDSVEYEITPTTRR